MANRPIYDYKYIAVLNHSGTHRVQWAQTIALDLAYMLCNWRSLTVVRDSLEHTITSTQEKEKGGQRISPDTVYIIYHPHIITKNNRPTFRISMV